MMLNVSSNIIRAKMISTMWIIWTLILCYPKFLHIIVLKDCNLIW